MSAIGVLTIFERGLKIANLGVRSRRVSILALPVILLCLHSGPAVAYPFTKALGPHSRGRDVRALEMRIAGWFPAHSQRRLLVDRNFGERTTKAVKTFQRHYGLAVDGIAGPQTFQTLARLEDGDGSTSHFSWAEFAQHRDASCSRRADRYAGTFRGGPVNHKVVKRHVREMMWRLEAIRAKAHAPVIVESGFRSIAYNRCIGGASVSQHLYGFAADIKMPGISSPWERAIARRSQIYGLSCYSSLGHNHLDLRLENPALPELHSWWWPAQDRHGRDLSDDGAPCRGE